MKNKEKFTPEELEAIKLFANKGGTWNNDWTRKFLAHITALERDVERLREENEELNQIIKDQKAEFNDFLQNQPTEADVKDAYYQGLRKGEK
jgi:predicted RNase H-like nuclease (RuvC/YqgF family)